MNAPAIVCGKAARSTLLSSSSAKLASRARPVDRVERVRDRVLHEALAARMMNAESSVPTATTKIVARCSSGRSRSQPNYHSARNVASRKNASIPSIASVGPKTSP